MYAKRGDKRVVFKQNSELFISVNLIVIAFYFQHYFEVESKCNGERVNTFFKRNTSEVDLTSKCSLFARLTLVN